MWQNPVFEQNLTPTVSVQVNTFRDRLRWGRGGGDEGVAGAGEGTGQGGGKGGNLKADPDCRTECEVPLKDSGQGSYQSL